MSRTDTAYRIALSAILLGFLLWQWGQLGNFAWKYDEGINAMKAELLRAGHRLYSQIWSDQPPLFTLLLAGAFTLAGRSVTVGRAVVLLLALLGALGLAEIVREVAGPAGMLVATLLLMVFPHFRDLSRLIMIGLPAISLGMLALAAGFRYQRNGRGGWLVGAGLLLGLSLLVKPLTAPFYPVLCALGLLPGKEGHPLRRRQIEAWGCLSLATVLPLLASLFFFAPRPFLTQVIGTYGQARQMAPLNVAENAQAMWAYFICDKYDASHWALLLLATGGLLGLVIRRDGPRLWPLSLWLLFTALALLFHNPLQRHQLLLLAFPMTALAGVGAQEAVDRVRRPGGSKGTRWLAFVGGLLALALIPIELASAARVDTSLLNHITFDEEEIQAGQEAVAFLQAHTPPGSTTITDDPMLAFLSDRRIPPSLAVPSARRVEAGDLNAAELIALSEEHQPSAILFWEERFSRLPAYLQWVMGRYCLVRAYPDSRYIYLPFDPRAIAYPQPARVGEGIAFLGSQLDHFSVEAGDHISVTLTWRAESPIQGNYIAFVHLLNGEGKRWGQVDRLPFEGNHPTDRWLPGQIMADAFVIPVHPDAPPGEMLLATGFYDPNTGERLPVTDEGGNRVPGDQIYLTPRPVVHWEGRFDIPQAIQHPLEVNLGEGVRLLGYELDSTTLQPGQAISLTFYWQARAEMKMSYTVFTHLLNDEEALVAQRDQVPGSGKYPTTGWQPGEVLVDRYQIPVPQELPVGTYQLTAGMYEVWTGERLPALAPDGRRLPEDRIPLGEIEVRRE